MKRTSIVLTTILIACLIAGFAIAENNETQNNGTINNETNNDNNETETDNNETETDNDNNETKNESNFGLGQIIRGRVKAGVYTSESGEQIRVRDLAQNRVQLIANGVLINCTDCNLTQETINNKTKLKLKLRNGRNAEIKIMPIVASQRALERLRLKVCSEDNNCTIELKEVGKGNRTQVAYEAKANKTFKIFGLFRTKGIVLTQIDAETGEEIKTKRPWWSFLASENEE
jgi:hypothetical protein